MCPNPPDAMAPLGVSCAPRPARLLLAVAVVGDVAGRHGRVGAPLPLPITLLSW